MKPKGCSILFTNSKHQVLLLLRDNISSIPYPNMWDIPGGLVEENETPEQTIVREMKEEIGMDLTGFELYKITDFDDRIEHTFKKFCELDIDTIQLKEGQKLQWFSLDEIIELPVAYGFKPLLIHYLTLLSKS